MIIETRAAEPFFKNGYVVGCGETREAVVIDPGDEVEDLVRAVEAHRLQVRYILLTHAHLDHVTGVGRAREVWGVPIGLHSGDKFLYDGVVQQGLMFGFQVSPQPAVDFFYDREPDRTLRFGRYAVTVHHTPGHCPGGVCLAVAPAESAQTDPVASGFSRTEALFVGDTLFAGSIGRTDLPGGDYATLIASIRGVLFKFPDDTPVYSGHGEPTTIGQERRTNPFLIS